MVLVIRREQMVAFERGRRADCAAAIRDTLERLFPARAKRTGPEGLRAFTDRCVAAGLRRGLVQRGDQLWYAGMMFVLGVDFEGAPEPAWVIEAMSTDHEPRARLAAVRAGLARRHHR
jgi:hypothetical protein